NQRLVRITAAGDVSHSPDIAGGDGGHTIKVVVVRSDTGALNHLPTAAIPVLDQRPHMAAGVGEVASHGPDIAGRDNRHPRKGAAQPRIGAGDSGPTAAVPVLSHQPVASHGPDIVRS